jgi:hypothetical protein
MPVPSAMGEEDDAEERVFYETLLKSQGIIANEEIASGISKQPLSGQGSEPQGEILTIDFKPETSNKKSLELFVRRLEGLTSSSESEEFRQKRFEKEAFFFTTFVPDLSQFCKDNDPFE